MRPYLMLKLGMFMNFFELYTQPSVLSSSESVLALRILWVSADYY